MLSSVLQVLFGLNSATRGTGLNLHVQHHAMQRGCSQLETQLLYCRCLQLPGVLQSIPCTWQAYHCCSDGQLLLALMYV